MSAIRRLSWVLPVAATLGMALPVAAQNIPRGSYAWWESPIVKDMNLSAEQMQRVHATVREFRGRLIDLRGAIQKADLDVEDSFNEENFDARRANEAVERLVAARNELSRTVAQLSIRLRAILTAEQWRELQKRKPQKQGLLEPRPRPRAQRRAG